MGRTRLPFVVAPSQTILFAILFAAQPAVRDYDGVTAVPAQQAAAPVPSEGQDAVPTPAEPAASELAATESGDAPTEPATPGPKLRASLDDGLGVDTADGRFGVRVGFLGSMRYEVVVQPERTSPAFALTLARPYMQVHLWGQRVTLLVQPELARGAELLDATAIVTLHPAFAIQAGQFRPWFTRGFRIGLPFQQLADRGDVVNTFRVDRDLGATILGRPLAGKLEYYVGVFNGEGRTPAVRGDPDVLVTARLVGAPLGRVAYDETTVAISDGHGDLRIAFAANATTNEVRDSTTAIDPATGETTTIALPDRRDVTVGGDLVLSGWRLFAQGEAFLRQSFHRGNRDAQDWGVHVLASGLLIPHRLDLAMRVGALRLQSDGMVTLPLEPGLNVYIADNHGKLQLRYLCRFGAADRECTEHRASLIAQIFF